MIAEFQTPNLKFDLHTTKIPTYYIENLHTTLIPYLYEQNADTFGSNVIFASNEF